MKKLHSKLNSEYIVPKEGQRDFECSNKKSLRCPSFGITNINSVSEDVALDYFGSILVEAFLEKKDHERNKLQSQTCSNICPSINQGAS